MPHSLVFNHMFQMPLPIGEKLLRPVVVYLVLIVLLRIFGKRELAQLNPFDLVVLLSLSNTVQNAIIGDDNSVTGGILGAFSLLAINWLVVHVLFRSRKLTRVLEGRATVLVRNGQPDARALKRESMTREELLAVIHRQGFEGFHHVRRCELEPNGTFYVEPFDPSAEDKHHTELMDQLKAMNRELAMLRGNSGAQ
ncbi:MAG TPA: YetF domain-containing protein [Terracidiphilus sp.]|nr:YetF domain-containing protein [Terracidiphilus sp.]